MDSSPDYKKYFRIAVMACLLALLAIYFSNRGCSPTAPYLCWTPAQYGGIEGEHISEIYSTHRARTWHGYCDAACRKPSECYYYCCGGDNRFDQSEAPKDGHGCGCFFGERATFGDVAPGTCSPGMAGNLNDLLERGGAGDMQAQLMLGKFYEEGRNGDPAPDAKEAFFWYGRAAEQGSRHAQYKLGLAYDKGLGVAEHCTRGMEWYEKAAAKREKPASGMPDEFAAMDAATRLGDIYQRGDCGSFDYAKAVQWYRQAAAGQQNIDPLPEDAAGLHLGDLYMKGGHGLEKNPAEAIKWYKAVAKAPNPPANARAEFELAMIYAKGDVVEQDFQAACHWYAIAGRNAAYRSHNICDPIEPYLLPGELQLVTPKIGAGRLPE